MLNIDVIIIIIPLCTNWRMMKITLKEEKGKKLYLLFSR